MRRFGVPEETHLTFFENMEAEQLYKEALERFEKMGGHKLYIDYTPFRDAAALLYGGPWVAERTAAIEPFLKEHPDALLPVTRSIIEGGFKVFLTFLTYIQH